MDKTKNGLDYYYIISKLLLEMPNKTPEDIELFLEKMSDFSLLNQQGNRVHKILSDHIYKE